MHDKVCAVIGIGPGNGEAFARQFGRDHKVALLSRGTTLSERIANDLPAARAYACDASDRTSLERALADAAADLGPIDTLVYNAGSGVFGTFDEVSAEDFEASWRINAAGLFNAARTVTPAMRARGGGAIIIVGATASRRGAAMTAAFAPAKAAQRSLAESLARQLWPAGIHVALIIVDGVIDLPRTRERMPDKADDFFLRPADIAETARFLVEQPRSAWSFEVEARPFGERW